MNVYFLKAKKEKRDWDTESVFSGCLKIFIKYLQQFYRIFTFIPHNGFLITVNECTLSTFRKIEKCQRKPIQPFRE